MLFKSKFFRVVSVLCLILSMTILAFADTIRLKDGSIIKGKIVNFTGGKFTVVIEDGARQRQMSFTADEVESISFDVDSMPIEKPSSQINNENNDANSTIITVGQTKTPTNPQTTSPQTNPIETTKTIVVEPKPIELNVKVLADNTSDGWTNSGWVVRKGQKIKITGNGRISLGNGRFSSPDGISTLPDENKLIPNQATGALIAVIGDDNNAFILIGGSREFTATRDGALFLGVNEGNLNDNTGSFNVKIEIFPDIGN